jgi:hypothetical protein
MAEAANDQGNVIDLDDHRPMDEPDGEIIILIWGRRLAVASDYGDADTAAALTAARSIFPE